MSKSIYDRGVNFLSRATQKHNGKYAYSSVIYQTAKTKVTIKCTLHGLFEQTPDKHLRGHGCPECGGTKRQTTKTFVQKATAVHGNKFDYSSVNYVDTYQKVAIQCKKHGTFFQVPKDHLAGCGCPQCDRSYKMTTKDFLKKAYQVHNNDYNYSQAMYTTTHQKIQIVCKEHGTFSQRPLAHLRGQGCPKCGMTGLYSLTLFKRKPHLKNTPGYIYLMHFVRKKSTEEFIKIGITKTNVSQRFKNEHTFYNITPLYERKMSLYDAFILEQTVISSFSSKRYVPRCLKGGKRECFLPSVTTEIQKMLTAQ